MFAELCIALCKKTQDNALHIVLKMLCLFIYTIIVYIYLLTILKHKILLP